mmetsp:Transcript_102407/g.289277  ORF Transcript_102407/g.289277 Transcript_102407/m.289277 type:complete len:248 (+) Transcript_102407:1020-1763(+)
MSSTRIVAFRSSTHFWRRSAHCSLSQPGNWIASKPSSSPGSVKASISALETECDKSKISEGGGNQSLFSSSVSSATGGGSSLTSSGFGSGLAAELSALLFKSSRVFLFRSSAFLFVHSSSMTRCFSRRATSQSLCLSSASGSPISTIATLRKCGRQKLLRASTRSSFVRFPLTSITTRCRRCSPSSWCKTPFTLQLSSSVIPVLMSGLSFEATMVPGVSALRSPLREAHSHNERPLSSLYWGFLSKK